MFSTEELAVLKWLNEKNAPLMIQMEVLQAFQLNQLLIQLDKRIMTFEEHLNSKK